MVEEILFCNWICLQSKHFVWEIIMSEKNVKELSLEEYVKLLNDKLVDDVSIKDRNKLKLQKNDLQKRIWFSFPNHNDENNIINNDKDNGENKDKGKVKIKSLDDLINIRTNIVSELLKQDIKKYPDPKKETNKELNDNIKIGKNDPNEAEIAELGLVFQNLNGIFDNKQLVLPKEADLDNPESMNECDKLKISHDDQQYILDGFMKGFRFDQLEVLTDNKPTEDFVKLCVILWRFININKKDYLNVSAYRLCVIEHLTYSSEGTNKYWTILYAFLNKIANVPNIDLAFATMKQVNIDDMNLRNTVKEDFKNFVATLRECNLKIVIQNNHMKAVRDRTLSLKKLALALGCPITLILTVMFIYNLIHVFIPIGLGVNILLLVIAIVSHVVFEIINIWKKIFHIPFIHLKSCVKGCNLDFNLDFNLDCYDYPENEKPEIEIPT